MNKKRTMVDVKGRLGKYEGRVGGAVEVGVKMLVKLLSSTLVDPSETFRGYGPIAEAPKITWSASSMVR